MQAGALAIALIGIGIGVILAALGVVTGFVGLIYLAVELLFYSWAAIAAVLSHYLPRRKSLLLTLGAVPLIWWTLSATLAGGDPTPVIPSSAYLIAIFLYPSSPTRVGG